MSEFKVMFVRRDVAATVGSPPPTVLTRYRKPIVGLYLPGAGTYPWSRRVQRVGGRNIANVVRRDWRAPVSQRGRSLPRRMARSGATEGSAPTCPFR